MGESLKFIFTWEKKLKVVIDLRFLIPFSWEPLFWGQAWRTKIFVLFLTELFEIFFNRPNIESVGILHLTNKSQGRLGKHKKYRFNFFKKMRKDCLEISFSSILNKNMVNISLWKGGVQGNFFNEFNQVEKADCEVLKSDKFFEWDIL